MYFRCCLERKVGESNLVGAPQFEEPDSSHGRTFASFNEHSRLLAVTRSAVPPIWDKMRRSRPRFRRPSKRRRFSILIEPKLRCQIYSETMPISLSPSLAFILNALAGVIPMQWNNGF